jgi:hypothetical protein
MDHPAWQRCEPRPGASDLPARDGLAILRHLAKMFADQRET